MHMTETAMRNLARRRRLFAVRVGQIRNIDQDLPDAPGKAQEFLITTAEGDKDELGHHLTPR
jgi:hypothetical protein